MKNNLIAKYARPLGSDKLVCVRSVSFCTLFLSQDRHRYMCEWSGRKASVPPTDLDPLTEDVV